MSQKKQILGRGLGGLISQGMSNEFEKPINAVESAAKLESIRIKDTSIPDSSKVLGGYAEIPVGLITPSQFQPRRDFDSESLRGLADSIREEGLLQPIVVRKAGEGYELIAGERRWRAFQSLRLPSIPARIIDATDASAATLALIENLQRESLNPIDEALGYASLIRDFDLTQEKAADRLGKSRAGVANALRLLRLSAEIQAYLAKGTISVGHAKVVLGLEKPEEQQVFTRCLIEEGWSVREAEKQLKKRLNSSQRISATPSPKNKPETASAIRDIEKKITENLSTEAVLKHGSKKGQLIITYRGLDDLQRILDKIGVPYS
jgi:ParB family transcriptional regulator, chromosome partitioning protein